MTEVGYNYSLSVDFPNGINNNNLKNEIIQDVTINKQLGYITIIGSANQVRIFFKSALSGPEQTALNAIVSNHNPFPEEDQPEQLNNIQPTSATGAVQISTFSFGNNIFQPAEGETGAIENCIINADVNTVINIDNNEIKSNAAIDATKIANGTVNNTEFQHLSTVTSNVQTQLNARAIAPGPTTLDQGLVRFNGTGGLTLESVGVRHYGASATDPSSPTPQAGDLYYNTAINHQMCYDGTRSKWLSVTTFMDGAGCNGNTTANTFYRRWNGMFLAAQRGPLIPKGTIIYIGYGTNTAVTHTYEVLIDGSVIASLASGGAAEASDSSYNADFDAGIMSSRNAAGSTTTNNFQSVIYYKLRA